MYLQRNGSRPVGDEAVVRINLPESPGENPTLLGQLNAPLKGQPLLSINGGPYVPVGPEDFPVDDCVSGEWRDWVSFRLPLDAGALVAGENTFRWKVGARPGCATGRDWWDGFSAKFLHVQTLAAADDTETNPPIDPGKPDPNLDEETKRKRLLIWWLTR